MPRQTFLAALTAVFVSLVFVFGAAAPASAAIVGGTTYYQDGGLRCMPTARGLLIGTPRVSYYGPGLGNTGIATVAWQPVIERYTSSGWALFTNTTLFTYRNTDSNWFQAAVNQSGAGSWTNQYTGRVIGSDYQVTGFPSGSFRVRSYLWKSSDGVTVNWYASGGGYCTFP